MDMQTMLDKWIEFCKTMNVNSPLEYFEEIRKHYLIPKRHYHTFEGHIGQGLEDFKEAKHICENPDLVYFSWLIHDAVYNPREKDNEEKSAEFAYNLAKEMQLQEDFALGSKKLIIITKHLVIPKTLDEKFVIDIDLSIFGQPKEIFDEYEKNIRKEYKWIEEETYKKARTNILKQFLNRENIYLTNFFRQKYEEKARKNLQRSLEKSTL